MVHDGYLATDVSLFNEFKIFQNVTVTEMFDQKVVIIKPLPRKDKEFPSV